MGVQVTFGDPHDVARIIDALLEASEREALTGRATLAARYLRIADELGDELDKLPRPSERLHQRGRRR